VSPTCPIGQSALQISDVVCPNECLQSNQAVFFDQSIRSVTSQTVQLELQLDAIFSLRFNHPIDFPLQNYTLNSSDTPPQKLISPSFPHYYSAFSHGLFLKDCVLYWIIPRRQVCEPCQRVLSNQHEHLGQVWWVQKGGHLLLWSLPIQQNLLQTCAGAPFPLVTIMLRSV
jgi:hypothetical protein